MHHVTPWGLASQQSGAHSEQADIAHFLLPPFTAFGPTAKCKTHVKMLSAPSNLCCHLEVRSLPVPEEGSDGQRSTAGRVFTLECFLC